MEENVSYWVTIFGFGKLPGEKFSANYKIPGILCSPQKPPKGDEEEIIKTEMR